MMTRRRLTSLLAGGIFSLLFFGFHHPVFAQLNITKRTVDASLPGAYWVYAYDINSDGEIDLVSGSGSQGLRWYRNNNNKTFTRRDIDNDFFGVWTVTAFDIDGDGDSDVAASSTANDIVSWWEQKTSTSWVEHRVDSVSLDPESNFAADVDGDGDGDLIVGGWESDELVWCENVDSTFVRRVIDNAFGNAHSVYAAHLNSDSNLDILGSGSNKSLYWLNNGNGTFTRRTLENEGGWSIFPVDLDSDGDIDVVRSHRITRDIDWFRNVGSGNFSLSNNIDVEFAPRMSPSPDTTEIWSVAAGDLDGDFDTDVVAAIYPKFNPNSNGYVYGWLNDGNENFTEFVVDSLVAGPRAVAVGDFDEDGDEDIAAATHTGVVWYETHASFALTIIQPNGGEVLPSASSYQIQWATSGTIDNVNLEYSIDGGLNWNTIIASTPNTGSHNWSVPNVQTSTALVRVSDVNSATADISNNVFTIGTTNPSLTLLAPNGGEYYLAGSTQPITWTWTGTIANVKLEYSLNGGSSWTTIRSSTPNDGGAGWEVPILESNNVRVRVSDVANTANLDISDATFTISSTVLTLVSPNGGESWTAGSSQQITWTSAGSLTFVKLEYSINDGASWATIVASTENDGAYEWQVPAVNSNIALVRISDASDAIPADVSDAVFEIIIPKTLTVLAPNGGENWAGGSTQTITWSSTGAIANVHLEYSIDDGDNWTTIAASTNNDGSESWNLPEVQTNFALVRVSDSEDPTVFDTSDGLFTIIGHSITVTAPNGGEIWWTGRRETITWDFTGAIPEARIEYSLDNGANWLLLRNDTVNDGRFHWIPPAETKSTAALMRVSATHDRNIVDASDGAFIIDTKTITLTSPNGGETWLTGSAQTIAWTNYGPIDSVALEFSLNNGASWEKIVETKNQGSYEWTLPATPSASALVRISGTKDSTAVDISDAEFRITTETLTIISPNGGEIWEAGSTHEIQWSGGETTAAVKLEFSPNNGETWNVISENVANTGGFSWQAPAASSDSMLVRVSDASDGVPADVSDNVFIITIIDGVEITEPGIPANFELSQNYPNPFNAGTKINFAVPEFSSVDLIIYNIRGERVRTLHSGELPSGRYNAFWDGMNDTGAVAVSGVYVYRIRIGNWQDARKLTLLK